VVVGALKVNLMYVYSSYQPRRTTTSQRSAVHDMACGIAGIWCLVGRGSGWEPDLEDVFLASNHLDIQLFTSTLDLVMLHSDCRFGLIWAAESTNFSYESW